MQLLENTKPWFHSIISLFIYFYLTENVNLINDYMYGSDIKLPSCTSIIHSA